MRTLFQTLGDQMGLIGYEWSETSSTECIDDSINTELWLKTSRRFLDGLGFNSRNNEILTMEASSGLDKEDLQHTIDDTLKNLNTSIINGIARKHLDASYQTFKNIQVFSIQTIRQTITLSSTGLDPKKVGHYLHIERCKADIPITYNEKFKWIRLTELLANLISMVEDQTKVMETLNKEQNGEIPINYKDSIRYHLLNNKKMRNLNLHCIQIRLLHQDMPSSLLPLSNRGYWYDSIYPKRSLSPFICKFKLLLHLSLNEVKMYCNAFRNFRSESATFGISYVRITR